MHTELLDLVGRTPLLELTRLQPRPGVRIFIKLEGQNPSGSIKDRVALALVEDAEQKGLIRPGDTLVEASSGNTGIALAMVARRKGYELNIVVPKAVAPSITDALRVYGVSTVFCDRCEDMEDAMGLAERLSQKHGWHLVGQFHSPANPECHYRTTGAEIVEQIDRCDVFIAGIGTGGTIMGVGRRLREAFPGVRIVGVEPRPGEKLQGLRNIARGFRPRLLDLDALDGRRMIGAADAIAATERIVQVEGINAGISGGACFSAALREAERMDEGNIVVMCSDSAWKYLPARPWDDAREGDGRLDDIHWW